MRQQESRAGQDYPHHQNKLVNKFQSDGMHLNSALLPEGSPTTQLPLLCRDDWGCNLNPGNKPGGGKGTRLLTVPLSWTVAVPSSPESAAGLGGCLRGWECLWENPIFELPCRNCSFPRSHLGTREGFCMQIFLLILRSSRLALAWQTEH